MGGRHAGECDRVDGRLYGSVVFRRLDTQEVENTVLHIIVKGVPALTQHVGSRDLEHAALAAQRQIAQVYPQLVIAWRTAIVIFSLTVFYRLRRFVT